MQTMHQGYKQRVWNCVGSALNGTGGVCLAVCVRTRPIDRDLIELFRDTIEIGRDKIPTNPITDNWSQCN